MYMKPYKKVAYASECKIFIESMPFCTVKIFITIHSYSPTLSLLLVLASLEGYTLLFNLFIVGYKMP